jgi:hypothetical protein
MWAALANHGSGAQFCPEKTERGKCRTPGAERAKAPDLPRIQPEMHHHIITDPVLNRAIFPASPKNN